MLDCPFWSSKEESHHQSSRNYFVARNKHARLQCDIEVKIKIVFEIYVLETKQKNKHKDKSFPKKINFK